MVSDKKKMPAAAIIIEVAENFAVFSAPYDGEMLTWIKERIPEAQRWWHKRGGNFHGGKHWLLEIGDQSTLDALIAFAKTRFVEVHTNGKISGDRARLLDPKKVSECDGTQDPRG